MPYATKANGGWSPRNLATKENGRWNAANRATKANGRWSAANMATKANGRWATRKSGSRRLTVCNKGHDNWTPDDQRGNRTCRTCANEAKRRWDARHPDYDKEYRKANYARIKEREAEIKAAHPYRFRAYRLKVYGLTVEQYQEMLDRQHGRCRICNDRERDLERHRLAIDHCHKTGKVRALLCTCCNSVLGLAKDDPEILEKAAAYLRSFL